MGRASSSSPEDLHRKFLFEASPLCRTVLENIGEGVLTVDLSKRITFFNRAAETITGFRREDAIGQYCFDILRADICANRCVLDQEEVVGGSRGDTAAFIINRTGDQVPVRLSSCFLEDEEGKISGFIEIFRDLTELERLRREISQSFTPDDIVGKHQRIRKIFAFLPDIAESDSAVLIEGPTGSGKELFARAIHHMSPRRNGPFIAVNCGALPDTLLESELFGYTKGAFTGASRNKPGRFLLADKGTLFLDEISNTSVAFQADLLRVLEQQEFIPLGDTKPVKTDFRIVAATNHDLKAMVNEGTFREDLYYRLNVVKITLPPLSERKEDIPLLVDHFIHKFNLLKGRAIKGLSSEAMERLLEYPFPGNIRELENIIEYAYILCKGDRIEVQHFPEDVRESFEIAQRPTPAPGHLWQEEAEKIRQALEKCNGNRVATARELGISRSTLWRKMKRFGLA